MVFHEPSLSCSPDLNNMWFGTFPKDTGNVVLSFTGHFPINVQMYYMYIGKSETAVHLLVLFS